VNALVDTTEMYLRISCELGAEGVVPARIQTAVAHAVPVHAVSRPGRCGP
jgi:hypothetical protein